MDGLEQRRVGRVNEDRFPTVDIPLADAIALGRIAETWESIACPEIRGAEFGFTSGGCAVIQRGGVLRYDPPTADPVPF